MAGLKLRSYPLFPAKVQATAPLTLAKVNGEYTFSLNINALRLSLDTVYAPLSAAEAAYWNTMYRLLDPAAYVRVSGLAFSVTVPAGQTYYAVNTWWARINGVGPFFHRKLSIYDAVPLPAGTVITSDPVQAGYLYYADPSLAAAPIGDPKQAFYARLNRLNTIALSTLKADVPLNSANNTQIVTAFPGGFTNAMLVGISVHDLSWVGVGNNNTMDEISDRHQMRFTSSLMLPFKASLLTSMMSAGANAAGDFAALTLAGYGMLLYQILPADW